MNEFEGIDMNKNTKSVNERQEFMLKGVSAISKLDDETIGVLRGEREWI